MPDLGGFGARFWGYGARFGHLFTVWCQIWVFDLRVVPDLGIFCRVVPDFGIFYRVVADLGTWGNGTRQTDA